MQHDLNLRQCLEHICEWTWTPIRQCGSQRPCPYPLEGLVCEVQSVSGHPHSGPVGVTLAVGRAESPNLKAADDAQWGLTGVMGFVSPSWREIVERARPELHEMDQFQFGRGWMGGNTKPRQELTPNSAESCLPDWMEA